MRLRQNARFSHIKTPDPLDWPALAAQSTVRKIPANTRLFAHLIGIEVAAATGMAVMAFMGLPHIRHKWLQAGLRLIAQGLPAILKNALQRPLFFVHAVKAIRPEKSARGQKSEAHLLLDISLGSNER